MDLGETVSLLMQERKGILLEGEATDVENERLAAFGAGNEDARRAYRELLLTTPGIETHLSGVILSPESVHESSVDGVTFPALLASKNISTGVLLDTSASAQEKFSQTLREYKTHGMTFGAMFVTTSVSDEVISDELQKNIHALAAAAKLCHAEGIVPVLAIDVSASGVHGAAHAEDVILETLSLLSDALKAEEIDVQNIVIGVSMAVSGSDHSARADAAEVAERTVRAATTALPEKTGGVVFLSDAQDAEEATANLNALARLEPLPWPIAFCFARALQEPVLAEWKGNEENRATAQAIFEGRLALLSRADAAGYASTLEER
ncbi:fructose-bisphosphate aldolase [Candidatus Kaiserbacteria bacterium]|nr:fructose-bisphosphate aldolase [Candidatus Kaiserbacteria bacterium]